MFCRAALLAAARDSEEGKHIFIPPHHGHGAAGNNRFQNTATLGFCWVRHTHICARGGIYAHSHPRTHTAHALKYTMNWPRHTHRAHKHPYSHRHNLDTFLGVMKHMLTCWADRRQLGSGPFLAFSSVGHVIRSHLMTFITLINSFNLGRKSWSEAGGDKINKEVFFLFI